MHLYEVDTYHVRRPSAQTLPPEVTISSPVHEGGTWKREAIGQFTHPRTYAGAKTKTAESTAHPVGRGGRRYNWLSVHSSNYMQQGGCTENGKVMQ